MTSPSVPPRWTLDQAPALTGRTAIVTGATGGIGLAVATGLAARGCAVVLAARNPAKAATALAAIRASHPAAQVRFVPLDCASLDSVAAFADAWRGPLDILVNNAAVMGLPRRTLTRDGFEQQFGVNHLAHFALTARLCAALTAAEGGGRVVNVASLAHRSAVLRLDDPQAETWYAPMAAYRQSKLATLMFALELHRRAAASEPHRRAAARGRPLRAFAAHPGFARTDIIPNGPGGGAPGLKARLMQAGFNLIAQSAAAGARPILFAATAPQATPGAYYGPDRCGETRGHPALARIFPQALEPAAAAALWTLSERLTGVVFP